MGWGASLKEEEFCCKQTHVNKNMPILSVYMTYRPPAGLTTPTPQKKTLQNSLPICCNSPMFSLTHYTQVLGTF